MIWYLFLESFRSEQKIGKNASKKFFKNLWRPKDTLFRKVQKWTPQKNFQELLESKITTEKIRLNYKSRFLKVPEKFQKLGCLGGIDTQKRPLYNTPTVNG